MLPPRANVLGVEIDRLDMGQTLERCDRVISSRGFAHHVSVNAAKVVAFHQDPSLRSVVQRCELVNADGQSVVWASRLLGDPLPERVPGIDLMQHLLELSERRGYSVYVLGARQEVLARAVDVMRSRHPELRIAGYRDGYFADGESGPIADEIRASGAQILFVAMPSPRKEYWLADHAERLGVNFAMGVGGAIDVMAGVTHRAPRVLQQLGLEWSFRLWQEPRRLFRRYTVTNAEFVRLLCSELAGRRARASRR